MTEQPQQFPPWADPTQNVKDLGRDIKDIVSAEVKRQDDLRTVIVEGLRREMDIRATYEDRLRAQESQRINAIRAVDVGAVQEASRVAAAQAGALAAQLAATAEASRAQVQAAATAAVTSLAAALEPIQKDIRDLRDAQSRGVGGKEQVTETREVSGAGRSSVGMIVGIIGVSVTLLALLLAFYLATKK